MILHTVILSRDTFERVHPRRTSEVFIRKIIISLPVADLTKTSDKTLHQRYIVRTLCMSVEDDIGPILKEEKILESLQIFAYRRTAVQLKPEMVIYRISDK